MFRGALHIIWISSDTEPAKPLGAIGDLGSDPGKQSEGVGVGNRERDECPQRVH